MSAGQLSALSWETGGESDTVSDFDSEGRGDLKVVVGLMAPVGRGPSCRARRSRLDCVPQLSDTCRPQCIRGGGRREEEVGIGDVSVALVSVCGDFCSVCKCVGGGIRAARQ